MRQQETSRRLAELERLLADKRGGVSLGSDVFLAETPRWVQSACRADDRCPNRNVSNCNGQFISARQPAASDHT